MSTNPLRATSLLIFFWLLHRAAPPAPDVVHFMADDIGWSDISAHGGGLPTPKH